MRTDPRLNEQIEGVGKVAVIYNTAAPAGTWFVGDTDGFVHCVERDENNLLVIVPMHAKEQANAHT